MIDDDAGSIYRDNIVDYGPPHPVDQMIDDAVNGMFPRILKDGQPVAVVISWDAYQDLLNQLDDTI